MKIFRLIKYWFLDEVRFYKTHFKNRNEARKLNRAKKLAKWLCKSENRDQYVFSHKGMADSIKKFVPEWDEYIVGEYVILSSKKLNLITRKEFNYLERIKTAIHIEYERNNE